MVGAGGATAAQRFVPFLMKGKVLKRESAKENIISFTLPVLYLWLCPAVTSCPL
jgi:hypothetical protein